MPLQDYATQKARLCVEVLRDIDTTRYNSMCDLDRYASEHLVLRVQAEQNSDTAAELLRLENCYLPHAQAFADELPSDNSFGGIDDVSISNHPALSRAYIQCVFGAIMIQLLSKMLSCCHSPTGIVQPHGAGLAGHQCIEFATCSDQPMHT